MTREDGRPIDALRPVDFALDASPYAEGSCLVTAGATRVLCTASVEDEVPAWRAEGEGGWVTAEYAMLPRATHTRSRRERGAPRGRIQEIQRLIGRSLRGAVDLAALGSRTVIVDCDVLQADGGTRTAAITGGWVALRQACFRLEADGLLAGNPVQRQVAAVSVGVIDGVVLLDLDYREDVRADVDMNVVATGGGDLIEIQGTAEGAPFGVGELDRIVQLALDGIDQLVRAQRLAVEQVEK